VTVPLLRAQRKTRKSKGLTAKVLGRQKGKEEWRDKGKRAVEKE
jgi:hypothetical protein